MRPAIASGIVNGPGTHCSAIGPLQLAIHMVQNHRAGEQKSTLGQDQQNLKAYIILNVTSFVCLVPLRLLVSGMAALYDVNG